MTFRQYNQPCWRSECGSSDAVTIYPDGWSRCYSCNRWRKPDGTVPVVPHTIKREPNKTTFPEDFTFVVPEQHRKWWRQYGIEDYKLIGYNFGWSEERQRIIIPIDSFVESRSIDGEGEQIVYKPQIWQERAVHPNQRPKYVNVKNSAYMPFKTASDTFLEGRSLVLVEDMLSAIKVHEATKLKYPSWALLGTGNKGLLPYLSSIKAKEVIIWLDGDIAGKAGSLKLMKIIPPRFKVRRIVTEKDPKCYTYSEIRAIIKHN